MRIREEVLNELDAMGIRVRCYTCSDAEMRAKMYDTNYRECLFGYFNANTGNEDDYTEEQKAEARQEAEEYTNEEICDTFGWSGMWYDSTKFYISYGEDRMISRTCGKGNIITKERIINAIEKDKKSYEGAYGKFTDQIRQLIKKDGKLEYFNIYPTTYGIGVWVFYNWHLDEDLKYMDELMKKIDLEYYNEYSLAKWVFRYKISKKRDNLKKLETYINLQD